MLRYVDYRIHAGFMGVPTIVINLLRNLELDYFYIVII